MSELRYEAPDTIEAALSLLASVDGEARVLAGGTDVLVQPHGGEHGSVSRAESWEPPVWERGSRGRETNDFQTCHLPTHRRVRTVHRVVNPTLNGLTLFRLRAAEGALDSENLARFDALVADTATALRQLGHLDDAPELRLGHGAYVLDVDPRG